jgi:hypothetical protein
MCVSVTACILPTRRLTQNKSFKSIIQQSIVHLMELTGGDAIARLGGVVCGVLEGFRVLEVAPNRQGAKAIVWRNNSSPTPPPAITRGTSPTMYLNGKSTITSCMLSLRAAGRLSCQLEEDTS